MKSKAVITLFCVAIFLFDCAPFAQTATETPVPPTATATAKPTETLVPTATATPKPQLSADEMNAIISSLYKNLTGGFQLKANPDGSYSITGADGKAVNNITLKGDGKFCVTEADGSELAIDPLTVHMPNPNKIYAELEEIDITTGNVEAVPIEDILWKTGKDAPSITEDTVASGRLEAWARSSHFGAVDVPNFFNKLDPNSTLKLGAGDLGYGPVSANGITTNFRGTALIPNGYISYPDKVDAKDPSVSIIVRQLLPII